MPPYAVLGQIGAYRDTDGAKQGTPTTPTGVDKASDSRIDVPSPPFPPIHTAVMLCGYAFSDVYLDAYLWELSARIRVNTDFPLPRRIL
jgi:hypothetical protein